MRVEDTKSDITVEISHHLGLLGHRGYGVTELRTFDDRPMVAYADNELSVLRLCRRVDMRVLGIYIGVQPRPVDLFDRAPNCWKPAISKPESNCACDLDIEYITACFWDIDVVSEERSKGYPASEEELRQSYRAAQLFCQQEGLALSSTICCSGNGHYVLAPIVPIPVYGNDIAAKFKHFCQQLAQKIAGQVSGVKIDPVYNLSRVMRLMGTVNCKGEATTDRPHRVAHFVTEPLPARSVALHHMIVNTEAPFAFAQRESRPTGIKCNLTKIETCEFIRWCRQHPTDVSEPLWFAMITNLAHFEGGCQLAHEISRLDMFRYDYQQTQRLIDRVLTKQYHAISCEELKLRGFCCRKLGRCSVSAPMYLTDLFSVWRRQKA